MMMKFDSKQRITHLLIESLSTS